ncbi:hypothetical protein KKH23_09980 [Patescibacteria group bacterium]|nr:hypothetical protein [Patescibacteria group bacterium]
MSLSGLAKLVIGVLFTFGFILLSAMEIIPAEAYIAVASVTITFIVEEWRKEKEIARLMANRKE